MAQRLRIDRFALASLVGVGLVTGASLRAAEKKAEQPADKAEKSGGDATKGGDAATGDAPKYTIEEVMEKAHKGKEKSMFSRVTAGKGSDEDKKNLVEYYEAMIANKPPKGDPAAWVKRNEAVLAAAKKGADRRGGPEEPGRPEERGELQGVPRPAQES
jgi:cytochrome c553